MLGRMLPNAGEPFAEALAALSACGDVAAASGHKLASVYVSGAAGSLRLALAALASDLPAITASPTVTFDERRVGASTLAGPPGLVDTIRNCRQPDGSLATVRALFPSAEAAKAVWCRPSTELGGLKVRGRVMLDGSGASFHDDAEREGPPMPGLAADLGRDLIAAGGLDLSTRTASTAALEATLATGSWVHLGTGRRWYCDPATAQAVVRCLGGRPCLARSDFTRLGVHVDREWLVIIEGLGWRHWPVPGIG